MLVCLLTLMEAMLMMMILSVIAHIMFNVNDHIHDYIYAYLCVCLSWHIVSDRPANLILVVFNLSQYFTCFGMLGLTEIQRCLYIYIFCISHVGQSTLIVSSDIHAYIYFCNCRNCIISINGSCLPSWKRDGLSACLGNATGWVPHPPLPLLSCGGRQFVICLCGLFCRPPHYQTHKMWLCKPFM